MEDAKWITCPVCGGSQTVGIEWDCWRCGGIGEIIEGSELATNWPAVIIFFALVALFVWWRL